MKNQPLPKHIGDSISLFFGLPSCGKTTLMVSRIMKFHKRYPTANIYCNVPLPFDYVTLVHNEDIGKYQLENGRLYIDEASLFADSRQYKFFTQDKVQFFLLHRHYKVDIELYTQQWDAVDKKIRVITDKVYYLYKPRLTGKWFTKYYRIPYGIIIPDPKEKDGEKLGDIVQGYCKPPLLMRLLCYRLYRPRYYGYFNSWEAPPLPQLPTPKPQSSVSATEGRTYSLR